MGFNVRLGTSSDIAVIKELAKKVWSTSLSPLRKTSKSSLDAAAENFFMHTIKTNATGLLSFTILILEETETKEIAGYLIFVLDFVDPFTLEKEAYLYDLAIEPKYWGKSLWKPLFERAEVMAKERKNRYVVSSLTASNLRSLAMHKRWGFEIERYQALKPLE